MAKKKTGRITAAELKKYKNATPWDYFDQQLVSDSTANYLSNGSQGVFNFANWPASLPFMAGRQVGNTGGNYSITNMNDTGKMDSDFMALVIKLAVWCDPGAPSGGTASISQEFASAIVNRASIVLKFQNDVKIVRPAMSCPAGGGVDMPWGNLDPTTDPAGYGQNGLPTAQAAAKLPEPILFKRGSNFTVGLDLDAITLAKVQALTPLVAPFMAGVRLVFTGIKGQPFLESTPNDAKMAM